MFMKNLFDSREEEEIPFDGPFKVLLNDKDFIKPKIQFSAQFELIKTKNIDIDQTNSRVLYVAEFSQMTCCNSFACCEHAFRLRLNRQNNSVKNTRYCKLKQIDTQNILFGRLEFRV